VDSLSKVLNPLDESDILPQSPTKVNNAAKEMTELRTLNDCVTTLLTEITQEAGQPVILHGMEYLQKLRFDLVLP